MTKSNELVFLNVVALCMLMCMMHVFKCGHNCITFHYVVVHFRHDVPCRMRPPAVGLVHQQI